MSGHARPHSAPFGPARPRSATLGHTARRVAPGRRLACRCGRISSRASPPRLHARSSMPSGERPVSWTETCHAPPPDVGLAGLGLNWVDHPAAGRVSEPQACQNGSGLSGRRHAASELWADTCPHARIEMREPCLNERPALYAGLDTTRKLSSTAQHLPPEGPAWLPHYDVDVGMACGEGAALAEPQSHSGGQRTLPTMHLAGSEGSKFSSKPALLRIRSSWLTAPAFLFFFLDAGSTTPAAIMSRLGRGEKTLISAVNADGEETDPL
ncbi:hypothetical protein JHW43_008237 [Diplocarpon mali]|nr:hypothetical protein JHW43_008237 [Diplocarpon mali]